MRSIKYAVIAFAVIEAVAIGIAIYRTAGH